MHIDVITVLPALLESPFQHSILKRAADKNLLTIEVHDLRKFGSGNQKQVDDYQYGGGAGMVMMIEPIARCIESLREERNYDEVIYMCPDGDLLDQKISNQLSLKENLIILCGHYKGVDERVREKYITMEISVGSYVLSGGELPAAILVDSIGRLIPGVISDETSALFDSFQDGLLAPPVYTRPAEFDGQKVPEILLSGDDRKIYEWRNEQATERTKERRPDLLED